MVMSPVLREAQQSVSLLTDYEDASPYMAFRVARSDSQLQESLANCGLYGGPSKAAACRRHSRRLARHGGKESGYSNNSTNLGTIVYSVCCICQFVSYLPLLVLRVCFGCQQPPQKLQQQHHQQDQQLTEHRRQPRPQPSVRTLTGLLLIGLPLMALASLPVVGRFVSLVTSPPARESRSRADSVSSGSCSRRSCSICSDTM